MMQHVVYLFLYRLLDPTLWVMFVAAISAGLSYRVNDRNVDRDSGRIVVPDLAQRGEYLLLLYTGSSV